ncbi:single-stranded-DNA-specific exonuclease RecJ [Catenovulum sp. SM1970]|uniref:single-stranded-DNA-specific exonuclease RecJ n=1 Tax=Marinifaba aquimaris TaxID=2741323 RepID=UPI001574BDDE|nr:single-stranded-DNA-specific exonuclease RecJ [Marinifaba aquimaris]NTS75446.1 single-stranded-DNA-specific exonuclease RecJ [Marinifaba aquimaris]
MSVQIQRRQSERASLDGAHQFHPTLQRILLNRGIAHTDELNFSVQALPRPELANIDKAVALLVEAIKNNLRVIVVGDFDADGATSTALSCLALKQLGANSINFLVPNRFDFGYGLSPEIVEMAHQQGCDLIMTVDNGISCIAGVNKAHELGIKVIVTDHHLPGEQLPSAGAIVNPNLNDCPFPSKNIAGVGVAFYLMLALRAELKNQNWFEQQGIVIPNLAELLDLVALGTVADVVTLDQVNRVLVQQGINRIRQGKCRAGIRALLDVAERNPQFLVSSDFGFAIGPRLNAAGRLDDMTLGITCLMTDDYAQAQMLACRLNELNKERREIESGMQQEAIKALDKTFVAEHAKGICLYDATWHQGVIGIVAGRIKENYYRPTVVFAQGDNGELKGSCRSINGFHIRDCLEYIAGRNPDLIIKFGGHAMAAGLSILESKFAQFKMAFEQAVDSLISEDALENVILTDGAPATTDYQVETAEYLKRAMPWGQNFPEPVFDDEFVVINERVLKEKHLKLVLQHASGMSYDAIWFNYDQSFWHQKSHHQIRVAFNLDTNHFRGKTTVQLMVKAVEDV